MNAALAALKGRPPGQIGMVVSDLDAALESYTEQWGLFAWRCWTYGPQTVLNLGPARVSRRAMR